MILPPQTHSLTPHSFISTNLLKIHNVYSIEGNCHSILVEKGLFYCYRMEDYMYQGVELYPVNLDYSEWSDVC